MQLYPTRRLVLVVLPLMAAYMVYRWMNGQLGRHDLVWFVVLLVVGVVAFALARPREPN